MYDIYYVSTPYLTVKFLNMSDAVSAVALACFLFVGSSIKLDKDKFFKDIYFSLFRSAEWSCYGVSVRGVCL